MYSMTGYGRGMAFKEGRELTIELKSVNNRFLDIGMKLPRQLSFLEDSLRKLLNDALSRGHVDVFVNYRNLRSDAKTVRVDEALLKAYIASARESAKNLDLVDDLTLSRALTLPDVTTILPADEDQQALADLGREAMTMAIDGLKAMRLKEGERLKLDLSGRMDAMTGFAAVIEKRAPAVAEEYRAKLTARIEEMLGETEVDRARLATEVAIFADRAAIDEEIVRLNTHLIHFRELLAAGEPVGRKMDFLVQEMNRECNTIGSKANDAELTSIVLLCKAEIEKLREQIQNIE
ncbi:MAG: YicC family protein [Clostridia bacterium]|nr:YicC family protein [Clostridia bacterium]